jgi:hypothetical protein
LMLTAAAAAACRRLSKSQPAGNILIRDFSFSSLHNKAVRLLLSLSLCAGRHK